MLSTSHEVNYGCRLEGPLAMVWGFRRQKLPQISLSYVMEGELSSLGCFLQGTFIITKTVYSREIRKYLEYSDH